MALLALHYSLPYHAEALHFVFVCGLLFDFSAFWLPGSIWPSPGFAQTAVFLRRFLGTVVELTSVVLNRGASEHLNFREKRSRRRDSGWC